MTKTIYGKVHGRTIELDEDPGVAEGQQVEITIKSMPAKKPWGEGLRRCAGALADEWTEEDDRILAAVALVHKLTLVTHNTADYQNVSGLRLDDWLTMNGETMIERCVIDQLDPLRVGKAQCPH